MTLAPAQLTQEEEQMVQLLTPSQGILLDFAADEQLMSLSVSIKELDGTQWVSVGGGSYGLEDSSGRIALQFDMRHILVQDLRQVKRLFHAWVRALFLPSASSCHRLSSPPPRCSAT